MGVLAGRHADRRGGPSQGERRDVGLLGSNHADAQGDDSCALEPSERILRSGSAVLQLGGGVLLGGGVAFDRRWTAGLSVEVHESPFVRERTSRLQERKADPAGMDPPAVGSGINQQEITSARSDAALAAVQLPALMERSRGAAAVTVGLIDGPVMFGHPQLVGEGIKEAAALQPACRRPTSVACAHGTAVAGVLFAQRQSFAPAICPGCALVVRPIFSEQETGDSLLPAATPDELAAAIAEVVAAGARVVNVSAALTQPSLTRAGRLTHELDNAARRGAVVVAAAGNEGTVGSSAITGHPSVIPVVACDSQRRPLMVSNLGNSIGLRGLSAPGERILTLGTTGQPFVLWGTSAATPLVSGCIALLWSLFPNASAMDIRSAVIEAPRRRRTSIVPPMLDALAAYRHLRGRLKERTIDGFS